MESSLGGLYAVVNKSPAKKKNKEVSDLLSSTVRAQLPLDATEQIGNWEAAEDREAGGKKDSRQPAGYVQLDFHMENGKRKGKITPADSLSTNNSRVDVGKTKFGYSTVVFEKEQSDKELAERKRQNKPPPQPPTKYEGSGPRLPKHSSDSRLLYSDVDFNKSVSTKHGISSPDLSESAGNSGYVNVRYKNAPLVPPRRGAAAIIDEVEEQSPVPPRKTS